ncbi:hypothetical protein Tco_1434197 [Tanacetum coccineum]
MDSIIPFGQKNTLAVYMILSGADNHPPMLDKDMYDSWKSRMEVYMQNREHRRMILESVENSPLIWPTIEENRMTRTKKYAELSATEKIQADCDMKATNIILQGLPADVYSLVNHHRFTKDLWERLVKDLHTTNYDQLHAYLQQHELHANDVRIMRERNQDPLALVANHQMKPSHFNAYEYPYNNPQFQQQFSPSQSPHYRSITPTQHYSTAYPSIPLVISYLSTPYLNAYSSTIHQEACPQPPSVPHIEYNVTWQDSAQSQRGKEMLLDPGIAEGPVTQSIITHNAAYQVNDLDAYDFDCDEISTAKAVLMANLSSYGSDVLS